MTWHRDERRLTCDAVLYNVRTERVKCPSQVEGSPTASAARRKARQVGWRSFPGSSLGDRCELPGHR